MARIFSQDEILKVLMGSRERISAAAWLVARDAQTAEDIFQNVSIKAITKDVEFNSEAAVLSWAFISARREAIDWLRRCSREKFGLDESVLQMLEQDWLAESPQLGGDRVEALRKCVDALPDKSSRMLRLRYFEGYSCGDVAMKLEIGLNAIYKRISRLHQGLRDCVELKLSAKGAGDE